MPVRLTQRIIQEYLRADAAEEKIEPLETDVFIAGSGPIAATYAREILGKHENAKVLMVEIGSQNSPEIGMHHKNSIKYQKDIDAFVHVIQGALQKLSIPPADTYVPTLSHISWMPGPNDTLVIQGHNHEQDPRKNLGASSVTRTVGGMATHWTCACPIPHEEERAENPIDPQEFDKLLERGKTLLNIRDDQFDISIRHRVVKELLENEHGHSFEIRSLPLAVQRDQHNPALVTWSGVDTILKPAIDGNPRFSLRPETRVTKLIAVQGTGNKPRTIKGALIRDLRTDTDYLVKAKSYVIACGAVGTPQILFNSDIRPLALGGYLSEQSIAFCQIVLKRSIIESIDTDPRFATEVEKHGQARRNDPLPIPFEDPEPQVYIPYSTEHPYHVQIHRDAFSYGEVGPKVDPRLVVDLRFFGKSDINAQNRVDFHGGTDIYGMPQPTFHVSRSVNDGLRDHSMMRDMTNIANTLGGYLPGSSPQFMEPGLALHITGTTRVGTNKNTSVCDPSSRVHDFDNLWLGGNGNIPDSTACNPTLTSVAYAIKGAQAVVEFLGSTA